MLTMAIPDVEIVAFACSQYVLMYSPYGANIYVVQEVRSLRGGDRCMGTGVESCRPKSCSRGTMFFLFTCSDTSYCCRIIV